MFYITLPPRCPKCNTNMMYKGRYYDEDRGECDVYECPNCGYRETYCRKITFTYNG